MCRFAAYSGPEILISSLVTDPKHSIIHQIYDARERTEPLNDSSQWKKVPSNHMVIVDEEKTLIIQKIFD